jgi:hypothetical protein
VRLFAQAFWVPKSGNHPGEYEDAFAPRPLPGEDKEVSDFRAAVADGATETSFSRLWARLLVGSYVRGQLVPDRFPLALHRLQERWHREVTRKPLPWYAQEKIISGAAAALVGLHMWDGDAEPDGGAWEAMALGDSCLFHVRDGRAIERFPLHSASEFSNRPFLLSSNVLASEGWQDHLKTASGVWRSDDSFYLMSDALAAWFMRSEESGGSPCAFLRDLGTTDNPDFAGWIGDLRSERHIRNDDVTLVRTDLIG